MLSRALQRRAFTTAASLRFPQGTVAGDYKAAVAQKGEYDAVRFESQRINWTLRELDRYSSAFAFGLLEAGFTRGDRLLLYIDQTASAESLTAQMGAIKAGVTVVTFDEKDDVEALDSALGNSGAKGLIFTPDTATGENQTRSTFVSQLIPELKSMRRGDELSSSSYPHLDLVVQTGHSAFRGVNKFRDIAVYANPALSTRQIPNNESDVLTHISLKDGKEVASWTSGELTARSSQLWDEQFAGSLTGADASKQVFMSADLETPFGFASFLACSTHMRKVFIPSTFNMSKVLKSVPRQQSPFLVCDEDFYSLRVPDAKVAEYQEMCGGFEQALIAGDSTGSAGQTSLFTQARATKLNKYTL